MNFFNKKLLNRSEKDGVGNRIYRIQALEILYPVGRINISSEAKVYSVSRIYVHFVKQ